jgi:uncharacterized membrane protein
MAVSSLRPSSPEPYENQPDLPGKTNLLGLDYNRAAALAYLPIIPLNIVFAVVWLKTEQNSRFLKFHAIQSLILTGGLLVGWFGIEILSLILLAMGVIGGFLSRILQFTVSAALILYTVISIIAMIKAYKGVAYKMPLIGDMASQRAE